MADINTILSWFQTGDFPTQAQFRETFLSFMLKGDAVSISKIEGLTEILQQTLSEEQFNNYQFAMATLIDGLAKSDSTNIDVKLWRATLGITNIATVDGETDGNVYLKNQTDLKFESLHARLDDLFRRLGAAGGICPLNENGKVSEEYLPNLTATAVHNFLKTKKVADEVVTVGSMITGSEVTMILSQVIDEDLDWSVYFNGVLLPKSLTSLEPNNSIKINLAPLNIEPVVGDYFVTKYYKL